METLYDTVRDLVLGSLEGKLEPVGNLAETIDIRSYERTFDLQVRLATAPPDDFSLLGEVIFWCHQVDELIYAGHLEPPDAEHSFVIETRITVDSTRIGPSAALMWQDISRQVSTTRCQQATLIPMQRYFPGETVPAGGEIQITLEWHTAVREVDGDFVDEAVETLTHLLEWIDTNYPGRESH